MLGAVAAFIIDRNFKMAATYAFAGAVRARVCAVRGRMPDRGAAGETRAGLDDLAGEAQRP